MTFIDCETAAHLSSIIITAYVPRCPCLLVLILLQRLHRSPDGINGLGVVLLSMTLGRIGQSSATPAFWRGRWDGAQNTTLETNACSPMQRLLHQS